MGARGPAPGDPAKLRGHNKVEPWTELPAKPRGRARQLPRAASYSPETRAWWKAIAESPMATQFAEPDWQQLLRLARLVELYWTTDDLAVALRAEAQIEKGETKLGLTVTDRARLRLKIIREEVAEERQEKRSRRSTSDPRLRAIEGGRRG